MSHHHGLVRLGMDLGLAVSDYNSHDTEVFDEIIKLSLAYVSKVKQAVLEGQIREDDIADYFALLGASWASIHPRVQNEYSVTANIQAVNPYTCKRRDHQQRNLQSKSCQAQHQC